MKGLIVPLTAAICFMLDFLSKRWALAELRPSITESFLPGLLQLTLTSNSGGAFGVGREAGGLMTFLALTILIALIFWIVRRQRSHFRPGITEQLGMGCLLGGALGNIFDRLTVGRVVDFLEFSSISFPVFNVADVLIDLGLILILVSYLAAPREAIEKPEKRSQ